MKIIGITGGVGAGKSEILSYLEQQYPCRVLYADLLAKKLQEPGEACHDRLRELLGEKAFPENGMPDTKVIAGMIFQDNSLLAKVNQILHPAVIHEIRRQIASAQESGTTALFFIEAALLIENGFDRICDELWYIYASQECRIARLKSARGYSDEKCRAIIAKQLSEETFRSRCSVIIDNGGTPEESFRQVDHALEGYSWHR